MLVTKGWFIVGGVTQAVCGVDPTISCPAIAPAAQLPCALTGIKACLSLTLSSLRKRSPSASVGFKLRKFGSVESFIAVFVELVPLLFKLLVTARLIAAHIAVRVFV